MQLTLSDIEQTNHWAKKSIKSLIDYAERLKTDPDKKKRQLSNLCPRCFYQSGRMHGNAFTEANCKVCDQKMVFGNTDTDKTCPECAKKYLLCRHRASDVDYKSRKSNSRITELKY